MNFTITSYTTGDETWVSFVNVETKERSKQWMHACSPNKPKKIKQRFSARKLMPAVFWDRKEVLIVEVMQQCQKYIAKHTKKKKDCVKPVIQNKRRRMLTFCVVLLHDNACPHTAAFNRALLEHFN
jgi:hypothetical protein